MAERMNPEREGAAHEASGEVSVQERQPAGREYELKKKPDEAGVAAAPAVPAADARGAGIALKDVNVRRIEGVLEEGLAEYFLKLNPVQQRTFKQRGESAAREIWARLERGKNLTKRIVEIITRWLRMLPGINRFFLEQESKIKTDKIISIFKR